VTGPVNDPAGTPYSDGLAAARRLDPDFVTACERLAAVPSRRNALSPMERELIALAVNASTTKLFVPGIRHHIRLALEAGATRDQLLETLELASAMGIHTATTSMPLLREALEQRGEDVLGAPLTPHQQQVKAGFAAERQSWTGLLDDMLRLDVTWLEAFVDYSTVPWRRGALPAGLKELMYIGIDAQTSHLYAPGIQWHLGNAFRLGVTAAQVLEVLEVVSLIGIHTMVVAAPLLEQECARAAAEVSPSDVTA
jgi:alkylhydroperoxidase/carboxymuconolactone decarboxylase family protein YurZ